MEKVPRGSDGRRLFSPEFKREQISRVERGELTLSELSRELGIACWNGEVVHVAFVLDCHDREVIGVTAATRAMNSEDIEVLMRQAVRVRFGHGRPSEPIQWLSDNGSIYTSLKTVITAEKLNLDPITTPVASPESNGMAEAFVGTLRRDYLDGAILDSGESVIGQLRGWIEDYNTVAPHSALGYRSPVQYRQKERSI